MRRSPAVWALTVLLAGGCSSPWKGEAPAASRDAPPPALVRALERIPATDATRQEILFDDTASLGGYASLALLGAPLLVSLADKTEAGTGAAPRAARFTVSAGAGKARIALLAGGQHGDVITQRLTAAGWRSDGGRLVAAPSGGGGEQALYRTAFAQARPDGDDLVYAGPDAQVTPAKPGGTLADDRRVKALAGCLGDVVAAAFAVFREPERPSMVAVGVRRPADGNATPRAVACAAWPSAAAADRYAAKVADALAKGLSRADNRPYAQRLRAPQVHPLGGDEHIVAWEADTPASARTVVDMLVEEDLPALPNCARLTPVLAKQICG